MSVDVDRPTPDDLDMDPLDFAREYEAYLREEVLPAEDDPLMRALVEGYLSAASEVND